MKNKNKNRFAEASDWGIKKSGEQFRAKKYEKIHKIWRELPKCIRLEELIGGLKKKMNPFPACWYIRR